MLVLIYNWYAKKNLPLLPANPEAPGDPKNPGIPLSPCKMGKDKSNKLCLS